MESIFTPDASPYGELSGVSVSIGFGRAHQSGLLGLDDFLILRHREILEDFFANDILIRTGVEFLQFSLLLLLETLVCEKVGLRFSRETRFEVLVLGALQTGNDIRCVEPLSERRIVKTISLWYLFHAFLSELFILTISLKLKKSNPHASAMSVMSSKRRR